MSRFAAGIIAAAMLAAGLIGGFFLATGRRDETPARRPPPAAVITVPATASLPHPPPVDAKTLGRTFVDISKRLQPVVVSLSTEKYVDHPRRSRGGSFDDLFHGPLGRFFGGAPDRILQRSMGSGVIVDGKAGYILTNHHVVEGATEIEVTLFDRRKRKAILIGDDAGTDLAVLRIRESGLPNAILGDSDALEVGEWVMAVGNPFGLNHTVTAGIVSGRGRILNTENYEDFIQTDAAINPGNSGGALVNINGEVIGISTAIASNTGYFQGAGFAIPINMAKRVMEKLIRKGYVPRGYLGIRMETLGADEAEGLGIDRGILIHQVERGTPAARAGLRAGDVIVAFQGGPIMESARFRNQVASLSPGSRITLKVWRDEAYHDFTLKLGERPSAVQPRQAPPSRAPDPG